MYRSLPSAWLSGPPFPDARRRRAGCARALPTSCRTPPTHGRIGWLGSIGCADQRASAPRAGSSATASRTRLRRDRLLDQRGDSVMGAIGDGAGCYDSDGRLCKQKLPWNMDVEFKLDPTGTETSRRVTLPAVSGASPGTRPCRKSLPCRGRRSRMSPSGGWRPWCSPFPSGHSGLWGSDLILSARGVGSRLRPAGPPHPQHPSLFESDYLPIGHAKICIGWSRHWAAVWLCFSCDPEGPQGPAETNCRAALPVVAGRCGGGVSKPGWCRTATGLTTGPGGPQ